MTCKAVAPFFALLMASRLDLNARPSSWWLGSASVSQEKQPGQVHTLSSVQFSCSVVSDSLRPHELQHARPPCPSPTPGVHSDSTSIESMMPSSHLILCHPLLLLPPIPPSIRVFSNELTSHEVVKVLEFQLQHHSLQRNPRADLQNGLVGSPCSVQGTLKSLLQHHSSKASILRRSAFFSVQLSHPYMTTGKTIA